MGRAKSSMYNGKSIQTYPCRITPTRHSNSSTGVISIDYVASKDNIADPFTKGLSRELVREELEMWIVVCKALSRILVMYRILLKVKISIQALKAADIGSFCSFHRVMEMVVVQNINNSIIRSILHSETLTGSNFTNWHGNLRIVLQYEKKLRFVEQPMAPAPNLETADE
ncbi:hypothetical protein Tco_1246468 [Tanacetum coccineum]